MSLLIRPLQEKDFKPLYQLVTSMRTNLTSLPPEKKFFKKKFDHALDSFSKKVRTPGEEYYLFVLENTQKRQIMGTCGIYAIADGMRPFIYFSLKKEKIHSHYFKFSRELPFLILGKDNSCKLSELCSLYLKSNYRHHHLGKLLSFSRYHFIHAFPKRFHKRLMSSLMGVLTPRGEFPFWKKITQAFFKQPFELINALKATESSSVLYELLPKSPLYLHTLPRKLQHIIGQVNPNTLPALKMLEAQGFHKTNKVDIIDAGPILEANLKDIRTIKKIKEVKIKKLFNADTHPTTPLQLVSNLDLGFRCSIGEVHKLDSGSVAISSELAATLLLEPGMKMAYSPLY